MSLDYTQKVVLDIESNSAYSTISAKSSDQNSRQLDIYIQKNGYDYSLHDGSIIQFRLRKPDGTSVIITEDVDKFMDEQGVYHYLLHRTSSEPAILHLIFSGQCLAAAGRGYADIVEFLPSSSGNNEDTQIISTVSFILNVMASPNLSGLISDNEFNTMAEYVAEAQAAAEAAGAAASAANAPTIGSNGNWYLWNGQEYVDSGYSSYGANAEINSISAFASSLPAGASPTVTASVGGTSSNRTFNFNFGIPNGSQGSKGDTGNGIQSISKVGASGLIDTYAVLYDNGQISSFTVKNGYSPTITQDKTGKVTTLIVTNEEGSVTVKVNDGQDGVGIPQGGAAGQFLRKASSSNYDFEWAYAAAANGVPSGGSAGQALIKNSENDYDAGWGNISGGAVPSGGTTGQILAKKSGGNYDTQWVSSQIPTPTSLEAGKILVVNASGQYVLMSPVVWFDNYIAPTLFQYASASNELNIITE